MNVKILTLVSLMTLFFITSGFARVLDDNVPLSQAPEKAQQTFKENTQNGMIENVEKRTMKKEITVYKAKVIKPDGKTIEITAEEDGTLVNIEIPHKKSHKW